MQAQALVPAAAGGELRPLLQQLLDVCQHVQDLGAAAAKSAGHAGSEAGASGGSREEQPSPAEQTQQALGKAAPPGSL
jgi:hypothetical protein